MILSAFPNQMNSVNFIKMPVKIPNITNFSFSTILTNIFAKQKSFLFSYFVNLDKKASEWYYRRRKCTETKSVKTIDSRRDLLEIVTDSLKHCYHGSTIMAVTIMMH